MHAIAIERTRANAGYIAMPDLIGIFRQRDALHLGATGLVEQAKLYPGRIG